MPSMLEKSRQFFPYEDITKREHFPIITVSLIITNTIIFIWSLTNFRDIINTYGFIASAPRIVAVFTSMFLHGGFAHLLGNIWYLWLFGDNVEDRLGKINYIVLYFTAGIAAMLTQYVIYPSADIPTIGASGAISGLLGAYVVLFPKVKIKTLGPFFHVFRIKALYLIALWFVIQLAFGALSLVGDSASNIAFFAHVGGFLPGLAAGLIYVAAHKKK